MKYLNELNRLSREEGASEEHEELAWAEALETLPLLLAPGAPHSADELWESLGRAGFTYEASWPKHDPKLAVEDLIEIAVQVNGKLRDRMMVPPGTDKESLEAQALILGNVKVHTDGKSVRKVIVVQDRLVNVVAA